MKKKKPKPLSGACEPKWKDEYYVTAFRLARQGMPNTEIARAVGVKERTFMGWVKDKPALKQSLHEARNNEGGTLTFQEYVYKQLPGHLREVWDQLQLVEDAPNAVDRIEALLQNQGQKARQHLFVHALVSSNFNLSEACRMVNVSKKTFDRWCLGDPEFTELIDQIQWHKGNFFEGKFIQLVESGSEAAVIHAAKTFNSDRGYGAKVKVTHEGTVRHDHEHTVNLEELDLDLETLLKIRDAQRSRTAIAEHVETVAPDQ